MDVSVVVPTYNRCPVLQRTVRCLLQQNFAAVRYEIVVVDDQSTDDTSGWLEAAQGEHLRLIAVRNPKKGRAQARNAGLAVARGDVICFVDDDVWVVPSFVEAHWEAHQAPGEKVVVIGGLTLSPETRPTLANAYEDTRLMRVERRIQAADGSLSGGYFRTGNVSVARSFLVDLGGFDESFHGYSYEDSELGYRLLSHGGVFRYAPLAVGCHFTEVTVPQILRKRKEAGASAITFLKRWPEVVGDVPVPFAIPGVATTVRHDSALKRCLKALVLSAPAAGLVAALLWLALRVGWRAGSFALLDLLGYSAYARAFREAARKVE